MEKKPLLTNQNVEGEPGAYPVYGALEEGYRPPPYAPTYPQKEEIEEKYKSLYHLLKALDIENCLDIFRQEQVTLDILPEISDSDLRDMKIPLGVRKKLSKHLKTKSNEEKTIKSNGEVNNQALYFAQLASERQLMIGGGQRQEQQLAAERQQLQADRNRQEQQLAVERQQLQADRNRQEQQLAAERQQLRNSEASSETDEETLEEALEAHKVWEREFFEARDKARECFVCKGVTYLCDYDVDIIYRVTDNTSACMPLSSKPPEFVTQSKVRNGECYACKGEGTLLKKRELCDYCGGDGLRGYVKAEDIDVIIFIKCLFFPILLFLSCLLGPPNKPATDKGTPEWEYKDWGTIDCPRCKGKGWKRSEE